MVDNAVARISAGPDLGGAHGIVGLFIEPIVLAVGWELMLAWIRDNQADKAITPSVRLPTE